MNTPVHVLVSLAALARGRPPQHVRSIIAGALVPDAPMFLFFAYQQAVGTPMVAIWDDHYFRASWQSFFDTFNSIPLAIAGLAAAHRLGRPAARAFFASAAVHCTVDLLCHHTDAHRHFLPFTDWRFRSPISYWNPDYLGSVGTTLEWATVVGCSIWAWYAFPSAWARAVLVAGVALSTAALAGWWMAFG